jgi:hypothetical protein
LVKLHTAEAKQKFQALKPQLADTLNRLRAVVEAEVAAQVAEQVPLQMFDKKIAKKVAGLLLIRFDDVVAGLLQMDR